MRTRRIVLLCILCMMILILDGKTALVSANAGIALCLQTVLPSLFPLIVVSNVMNGALLGINMRFFSPLAKFLRIPSQAISLPIVGFLGGYPMGAACVSKAVRCGALYKRDGERMLAFCSNAGPAFVFGMGAHLFPDLWLCFLAWGIHITSALIVGLLTSGPQCEYAKHIDVPSVSLSGSLQRSIHIMGTICGWIVLFRIVIGFMERWIHWRVAPTIRVILAGFLELSNGICALGEVDGLGLRLTLFCALISFGGLCVWMQTSSVCDGISIRMYFPGKLAQAAISIILCFFVQPLIAHSERWRPGALPIVVSITVCVIYAAFTKKSVKSSGNCRAAIV